MRVAIIDLGTNSVRFDVHSLSTGGKTKLLHREKLMIRLGQGVFLKGRMDPVAAERTVQAFHHFQSIAQELHVQKMVAFGTSALREASDGPRLAQRIQKETGIELRIISGAEEAKLIASGILSKEKALKGRFGLIDIGGGSTEISLCQGKEILHAESFRLGTARLQQVFLKRSPPKSLSIAQMRGYIRNVVTQKTISEAWPRVNTLIGSSGTVKALAKIMNVGKKGIEMKDLTKLIDEMSLMTTTELLEIEGMESKRVDMILAGAILLEEMAYCLGAKKVIPSDYSLRDGIMEEEVRMMVADKDSLLELHLEDLFAKAKKCGLEESHLRLMVGFASHFFDRLAPLHKLDSKWKVYLLAAVILRNTGAVVGLNQQEKHSYYIVKNSDFPSMLGWEQEFIAQLCLFHASGKLQEKDFTFLGKDKKQKTVFLKILSLLRIVDALDIGPKTILQLKRLTMSRSEVKVVLSGKATAGLENLLLERKKKLFVELFHKSIKIDRS